MENRRTFLGMAAASLLPVGLDAQTAATAPTGPAPARPGGELARHALTGPFDGYEAVLVEVTASPIASAPRPHRHPGFVVGYVIDGQLRFAIDNQAERLVPAGGTFFEPIGALHSTNGSGAGAPARFLAFLVVPKGSPVVAPA
jgi:quercetin dioxygenase-like cupin family protein